MRREDLHRKPYNLALELVRPENASQSVALRFEPQPYLRRWPDTRFCEASFPWTPQFLEDLANLHGQNPDPEKVERLGHTLRNFLCQLDWVADEVGLGQALAGHGEVDLSFSSNAAEMYALPW